MRAPVESSPVGIDRRRALLEWRGSAGRAPLALLAVAALALAVAALGHGGYIYAKAALAQRLLDRAWQDSQRSRRATKPWPWADTQTIARLAAPAHGVDLVVLAGASGRTLAFAPAHLDSSANPRAEGTIVISGHRDTHFRFLRDVVVGETMMLEDLDGRRRAFVVRALDVVHRDALRLPRDPGPRESILALVTCYPFDAVSAGGPWRYVVIATEAELPRAAPIAATAGLHGGAAQDAAAATSPSTPLPAGS